MYRIDYVTVGRFALIPGLCVPAPTNNSSYIGRVISFYFVFVFCICDGRKVWGGVAAGETASVMLVGGINGHG